MKINITMLLTFFLVISSYFNKTASGQNHYTLIKALDNIEIRKYHESMNASYFDKKTDNYFRNLANYIFGGNDKKQQISMTSPVTMRLHGNKEMIFRLPNNFLEDSIPQPDNSKISIFKIPSTVKAIIKYSGYSNTKIEKAKKNELIKILKKYNIEHKNDFEVNVYNPPYQFINRKNEITVTTTTTFEYGN
jgi:hypothetical protein